MAQTTLDKKLIQKCDFLIKKWGKANYSLKCHSPHKGPITQVVWNGNFNIDLDSWKEFECKDCPIKSSFGDRL